MTYKGFRHYYHFYAFTKPVPGSIRIAVGISLRGRGPEHMMMNYPANHKGKDFKFW